MNAIQMRERIDQKNDRTKTSRFTDTQYYDAINQACMMLLKERVEPIRSRGNYSVQSTERLSNELYTLIPAPATIAPVANVIAFPALYYYTLRLYVTLGGVSILSKKTSYNTIGPSKINPFTKPSIIKPYHNEFAGGLLIEAGGATATSSILTYIKQPAKVSIGFEDDKLVAGATLTNAVTYYVYDESVYATVTYYPGEIITGTGATLTSGTVIINSTVVNSDFPENMHEEICDLAAAFMQGTVEDYNKKQMLDSDAEKS
mgnify:CR=1 FL=1